MLKNKIWKWSSMLVLSTSLLYIPSCKKYVDPPPFFEEPGDTTAPASRRVLIIGIDGAVGSEWKTIAPTNLVAMQAHSKYTWDGISDERTTSAASWKTLMSGKTYSSHRIVDSSFIYTQDLNSDQHAPIPNYPSFFSYILSSSRSDTRTTMISPWGNLLTRLAPEVEDRLEVASDAAVKDSVVSRLTRSNREVIIANFNGVARAGMQHGFSATAEGYRAAVVQVDAYLGEIMTALKARPGYNKNEEWLVIVTGTHGGNGNSFGGKTNKETNVFSFFYNENLKPLELTREGSYTSVNLQGAQANAVQAKVADANAFNFGTGELTIQLTMNGTRVGGFPHFFHKKVVPDGGTVFASNTGGFTCFASSTGWGFEIRANNGTGARMQAGSRPVTDGNWHTLTIVFMDTVVSGANRRYIKRYTDGFFLEERDITTWGNISSTAPLTLGYTRGDGVNDFVNFYASNLKIFNKGLTAEEVRAAECMRDITQHPRYNNLVGYYTCNDPVGDRFLNTAPNATGTDMLLNGNYRWNSLSNLPCQIVPVNTTTRKSLQVKTVDIATTLFYWLRIPQNSTWQLEGGNWLEQFEIEFVKF
jgi:hypothetical protein